MSDKSKAQDGQLNQAKDYVIAEVNEESEISQSVSLSEVSREQK